MSQHLLARVPGSAFSGVGPDILIGQKETPKEAEPRPQVGAAAEKARGEPDTVTGGSSSIKVLY
eukprot:295330-Hanusia_phi.AAC.1